MSRDAGLYAKFLFSREPWQVGAACRAPGAQNLDLFFPKRGQSTAKAHDICEACPVRLQCDDYAQRTQTEHGIWGGESRRRSTKKEPSQAGEPEAPDNRVDETPPPEIGVSPPE